jgi:hypothetical protein
VSKLFPGILEYSRDIDASNLETALCAIFEVDLDDEVGFDEEVGLAAGVGTFQ